jgi:hypothetical protein
MQQRPQQPLRIMPLVERFFAAIPLECRQLVGKPEVQSLLVAYKVAGTAKRLAPFFKCRTIDVKGQKKAVAALKHAQAKQLVVFAATFGKIAREVEGEPVVDKDGNPVLDRFGVPVPPKTHYTGVRYNMRNRGLLLPPRRLANAFYGASALLLRRARKLDREFYARCLMQLTGVAKYAAFLEAKGLRVQH